LFSVGWQIVRKNGLTVSVIVDKHLGMSAAAARTESADVISLDDYRRMRAGREAAQSAPVARAMTMTHPMIPAAAAVPGPMWVYWVPVWIW
jgi:hypothetical protein